MVNSDKQERSRIVQLFRLTEQVHWKAWGTPNSSSIVINYRRKSSISCARPFTIGKFSSDNILMMRFFKHSRIFAQGSPLIVVSFIFYGNFCQGTVR